MFLFCFVLVFFNTDSKKIKFLMKNIFLYLKKKNLTFYFLSLEKSQCFLLEKISRRCLLYTAKQKYKDLV